MPPNKMSRELKALTSGCGAGSSIVGIPSRTRSGAVYKASAHNSTKPPAQIITPAQAQPPRQPGARQQCLYGFDLAALPQIAIEVIIQSLDLASKRGLRLCSVALKKVVSQEIDSLAFGAWQRHLAGRAFPAARKAIISCDGDFPSLTGCVRDGFFTNLHSLRVECMSRASVKSLSLTALVSLDLSRYAMSDSSNSPRTLAFSSAVCGYWYRYTAITS